MESPPADESIERTGARVAEHAALSDVGQVREGNEDSYLASPPLFVVADGMGGAQAGEVASSAVIEAFEAAREQDTLPESLLDTIQNANARIYEMASGDRSLAGMGTTTTAVMVVDGEIAIAHVGDSRAYRMRDGKLEQLTDDHSLVGGLVRLGKLTPAEAETHPQRSVILRAVGVEANVEVDLFRVAIEDGDVYLLCSDGLSSMVRDEVIEETLRTDHKLDEVAEMLVDLANASGGRDNVTVALFRVAAP
jgi:serine/threonine protein phosphatase PrpC